MGVAAFLFQRDPPVKVEDLFEDFKDGVKLLCLLEVLSGEKIVSLIWVPI